MRVAVVCTIALACTLAACGADEPREKRSAERAIRVRPAREGEAPARRIALAPLRVTRSATPEEPAPPASSAHRVRFAPPESPMASASASNLASPDADERERAVLDFEGDVAQLGALATGDASPAVRRAAVQRLADGDGPAERSALRRALADTDASVVSEAIFALETQGDAAAIPALEGLSTHPDAELRALAADALDTLRR